MLVSLAAQPDCLLGQLSRKLVGLTHVMEAKNGGDDESQTFAAPLEAIIIQRRLESSTTVLLFGIYVASKHSK